MENENDLWYHGTDREFEEFDLAFCGSRTDPGEWGKGFYFTKSLPSAKRFAGRKGRVIYCQLDLKNPAPPEIPIGIMFKEGRPGEIRRQLMDLGFDGVRAEKRAMVVDPGQIVQLGEEIIADE